MEIQSKQYKYHLHSKYSILGILGCLGWFLACCKGKIYINCRDQYFWTWESVGLRKQPTHYAPAFFYKCQPQNQQFLGSAFYCFSHKINIFQAHNFIVPAAKSTFSGPRILLYPQKINNSHAQHFIVPAAKLTILRPSILLSQLQN